VRAFDVATGEELPIRDAVWKRQSLGVGYLTDRDMLDPNFPRCRWQLPAGSPDPYAIQFRAVASRGDGCPTLELPYATPLNLVVDGRGVPVDGDGREIGRDNPLGVPRFEDTDHDGDLYDDSFLLDTRLRPLPDQGSSVEIDRYSVVVPDGIAGPIAVTGAVYYQSIEAVVALKLLGNLADTDGDHVLEPCVLGGRCDGRIPEVEPAVVEGSPPVPVRVVSRVIDVEGESDLTPPAFSEYPTDQATSVPVDVVPKVTVSEPVSGVDETSFRLYDAQGVLVEAKVDQISDFTWALFPDAVFLRPGQTYFARLAGVFCDHDDNCTKRSTGWSFTVGGEKAVRGGDTRAPAPPGRPGSARRPSGALSLAARETWAWVAFGLMSALLVLLGAGISRAGSALAAARRARFGTRRSGDG
jgi:hypothetical protein